MTLPKDYDVTFKILVLGDSGVGKTCLIRRFTDNDFTDNFLSTIGMFSKNATFFYQKDIKWPRARLEGLLQLGFNISQESHFFGTCNPCTHAETTEQINVDKVQ